MGSGMAVTQKIKQIVTIWKKNYQTGKRYVHRVKHSSNVDSYKTKSKDTFSLSQQLSYPQNSWKEKLHRKLRCLREWVYLPLKNITSLRKVVIASKVKSGSQAWGRVGPFGLAGTLGGPALMTKEIPQWIKKACGNTYRKIFPKRIFFLIIIFQEVIFLNVLPGKPSIQFTYIQICCSP